MSGESPFPSISHGASLFMAHLSGWYYFGPRSANGGVPKRATLKAFTRSITFNLGSIAFGSLIVTILELLRLVLNSISQYEGGQGDSEFVSGTIILCLGLISSGRRSYCLLRKLSA